MIVDAVVKTSNISLMNLDLGDCRLTVEGAKHIARLIESNNTITILTVSGNSFELEGWKAISNALKGNTTLETLSLDFNEIGDEEAVLIAEGLQECKKLRSIDLEGNKIGDEGGRRLFKAVKMNKSIVDLTLFPMNQISKEIMDDVKELLELRAKGIEPEEAEIVEDNTDKLQGDQKIEEKPQDDQNKSEQVIDVTGTIESEQQKGVPAEESRQKGGSETEENQGTEDDSPEKISGDASDDAEATKDGSEGLEDENQRYEEVAATDEEETGTSLDEQRPEKEEVKSAKTDGEENNAEQGSLDERGPLKDGEVSRLEEAATVEDPQNKNEREKDTKDDKDTGDVVPPQNEEQNEKPRHDSSVEEPSEEIPSEEGSTGRGPSADELSEQERPVKEETKEKKKLDEVSPGGKVLEDRDEGTVEQSWEYCSSNVTGKKFYKKEKQKTTRPGACILQIYLPHARSESVRQIKSSYIKDFKLTTSVEGGFHEWPRLQILARYWIPEAGFQGKNFLFFGIRNPGELSSGDPDVATASIEQVVDELS